MRKIIRSTALEPMLEASSVGKGQRVSLEKRVWAHHYDRETRVLRGSQPSGANQASDNLEY